MNVEQSHTAIWIRRISATLTAMVSFLSSLIVLLLATELLPQTFKLGDVWAVVLLVIIFLSSAMVAVKLTRYQRQKMMKRSFMAHILFIILSIILIILIAPSLFLDPAAF